MNYLVYKHTSPSGKSYIGITKNYTNRCSAHRTSSGCRAFHSAITKYGWSNFTHDILARDLTLQEATTLEIRSITDYNTLYPHGYNLTTGGETGQLCQTALRIKAENNRKRNAGKSLSPEHRQKISTALTGRPMSEERKLKNTRKFTIIDPVGVHYTINNLHQFCKQHSLHNGSMTRVARGELKQYRGWLCSYAD